MQRKLIAIIIGIFIIGAGVFLYLNNVNTLWQIKQTGQFSQGTNNYPLAKESEVVTFENGQGYELTASIVTKEIGGQKVKMLAYNGSIPGPLIKVPQGVEITLNFKN